MSPPLSGVRFVGHGSDLVDIKSEIGLTRSRYSAILVAVRQRGQKISPMRGFGANCATIVKYFVADACVIAWGFPMPTGSRYRQYAEECLRSAQAATPVQRAHLLRVARTWFEIADQTDASETDERESINNEMPRHAPRKRGIQ